MDKRQRGTISAWNDGKGYGFITPTGGAARVFVHISAFPRNGCRPRLSDAVSFRVARERGKRARAEKVRFIGKQGSRPIRRLSIGLAAATAVPAAFFAVLVLAADGGRASPWLVGYFACMSVLAFIMYGRDKAAAVQGRWRTPEGTLHLLEVLGGWPGALVAQRLYRHKTRKRAFQITFWCAAAVNCGGLAWVLLDGTAVDFGNLWMEAVRLLERR